MKIVKTVDEVRVIVKEWKKEGLTVGLVPTMGFLHEGHKSLITRAVSENDRVVVSDFVKSDSIWSRGRFGKAIRGIWKGILCYVRRQVLI